MLSRLRALQERGRPLINSGCAVVPEIQHDDSLKKEIDALYKYYFGREISGCGNCYADALIELCTMTKSKMMSRTELFVMRRGKVLKDRNDARLNLVRGNETEELALHHLYTNPSVRQHFEKLPDNNRLDEMLSAYGEKIEAERNVKHGGNGSGNAEADKIINDARDEAVRIIDEAELRATVEIVDNARVEAETIIDKAKAEAKKIIANAKATAKKSDTKTESILE